jgi:UDP-3-O-acyl-N-acetylglucosamine deacetylase
VGEPIKGHVVAIKSGHKLNMELVNKLKTENIK